MKTAAGLLLLLAGAGVMLYGLGTALIELVGLYQGAVGDPLGQQAGVEKEVSDKMIRAVIIGAIGIPPFLIGSVLLKVTLLQKLMGRRK